MVNEEACENPSATDLAYEGKTIRQYMTMSLSFAFRRYLETTDSKI